MIEKQRQTQMIFQRYRLRNEDAKRITRRKDIEGKKERKQPRGDVKSRINPMNEAHCKSTSVDNMLVRIMMIGPDMHMPSDDAF